MLLIIIITYFGKYSRTIESPPPCYSVHFDGNHSVAFRAFPWQTFREIPCHSAAYVRFTKPKKSKVNEFINLDLLISNLGDLTHPFPTKYLYCQHLLQYLQRVRKNLQFANLLHTNMQISYRPVDYTKLLVLQLEVE
jgi:hypothetical protein